MAYATGASVGDKERIEVGRWHERISLADKAYKKWEKRFLCKQGWEWYEGYQGRTAYANADPSADPYIINLLYPTIEVKIPSLFFRNPGCSVVPRPQREDDPMTTLMERARLSEDTANSFMTDPSLHLQEHINAALKDSFFYFGMIETGYSAQFINNPNAGKPVLAGDFDQPVMDMMAGNTQIMQPPQVPTQESIYYKRIPPQNFRVSIRSTSLLEECDWAGYCEWWYAEDIRRSPILSNRDKIKSTAKYDDDYTGKIDLNEREAYDGYHAVDETPKRQGMVKVWKLYDFRTQSWFMVPSEQKFYLLPPIHWGINPFGNGFKHHERSEGWYPLPPHFNLLSPQAELNETREKQRSHRRRMDRRYQMVRNAIADDELVKLESGGDGTIVQTNGMIPAIIPIEDAPLDPAVARNVPETRLDFMEIASVGSNQREAKTGGTATEATVVETRARIRESFGQMGVAKFVGAIARCTIETSKKFMALPFWIQRNVDPISPTGMMEAMRVAQAYQEITSEELGPLTYDVSVEAESLSPINDDIERQQFDQALLALTSSMVLMLFLRMSDMLLRKWLSFRGIRNEKAIQQFKLAIELTLIAMGSAAAQLPSDQGESATKGAEVAVASASGPGGGGRPQLPGMMDMVNQLRNQIGLK